MSEPAVAIARYSEALADRTFLKLHGGSGELKTAATVTVRAKRRYRHAAESVFESWLKPEIAGRWLFATATRPLAWTEIDARVGGRFRLVEASGPTAGNWAGAYVAIEPCRRLAFTLSGSSLAGSTVTIDFVEEHKGCRLSVWHDGVPRDRARSLKERWIGILYGLGATLDDVASKNARSAPTRRFGCISTKRYDDQGWLAARRKGDNG